MSPEGLASAGMAIARISGSPSGGCVRSAYAFIESSLSNEGNLVFVENGVKLWKRAKTTTLQHSEARLCQPGIINRIIAVPRIFARMITDPISRFRVNH